LRGAVLDPESVKTFLRRRFSREEVVGLYFTVAVLACIMLAVLFGILADEVFEVHKGTNRFDQALGVFLRGLRGPRLTIFASMMTQAGDWIFLTIATPLVGLVLWFEGHRISALLFGGSVVGGFLVSTVLKLVFARPRPDAVSALVQEKLPSFPSGHATMATVFFGGLVAVAFHLSRRRSVRVTALTVGLVLVIVVAATRIYLGAHWATDTVAGILVGMLWVVVYVTGTEFFARRRRRDPAHGS
jgi:undecaprenyl-diphosphatase